MQNINQAKILIVIVLYKQNLFECESYKSFSKGSLELPSELLIYDNSPVAQHNAEELFEKKIHYIHDKSNPGVSGAYNNAANFALQHDCTWMLILDQDTEYLPDTIKYYKDGILYAASRDDVCIVAPALLDASNKINSPARNIFGRYFTTPQLAKDKAYKLSKFSCMNSGLLIKLESFNNIGGYDIDLFYNSDHDFCHRLGKIGMEIYLSKVIALHTPCGGNNSITKQEMLYRFSLVARDGFRHATKLSIPFKIGCYSIILTRAIKIAYLTKSSEPFKEISKQLR